MSVIKSLTRVLQRPRRNDGDGDPLTVPANQVQGRMVVDCDAKLAANANNLRDAAWHGFISDGELRSGFLAMVADAEARRTSLAIAMRNFDQRVAGLHAEMTAYVHEDPAEEPIPTVLGTISKILPFNRGE